MVHWDRRSFRKKLMAQVAVLLSLIVFVSVTYQHKKTGLQRDAKPLTLISKEIIPLKEISGIASFVENGVPELAFIGDDKSKIYLKGADKDYSFKDILVERFSLCQNEDFDECSRSIKKLTKNWEALAVDGEHRFFALQEHSQTIVVMNRGIDRIEHVLQFNFVNAFSEAVAIGSRKIRKNALGEGLILLKRGHVLIAKEAFPVALVEFGPEGEQPLGLSSETVLGAEEAFQLDEAQFRVKLVPLSTWMLAAHGKCDISDLALDEDRSLLALSEVCLTIHRFPNLSPGKAAEASDVYVLPGEVRSPEALVVVGKQWLVGSDVSSKKQHNFYRLSPQTVLR